MSAGNKTEESGEKSESLQIGKSEPMINSQDGKPPSPKTVAAPVEVSMDEGIDSDEYSVSQPGMKVESESAVVDLDENKSPQDVVSSTESTQADADSAVSDAKGVVSDPLPESDDMDKKSTNITAPVQQEHGDSAKDSEPKVAVERKPRSARSSIFDGVIRNALDPKQVPKARQILAAALNTRTEKKSVPYPYNDV